MASTGRLEGLGLSYGQSGRHVGSDDQCVLPSYVVHTSPSPSIIIIKIDVYVPLCSTTRLYQVTHQVLYSVLYILLARVCFRESVVSTTIILMFISGQNSLFREKKKENQCYIKATIHCFCSCNFVFFTQGMRQLICPETLNMRLCLSQKFQNLLIYLLLFKKNAESCARRPMS